MPLGLEGEATLVDLPDASMADSSVAAKWTVNYPPYVQLGDAPLATAKDQRDILWQTMPTGTAGNDSFSVVYRRVGDPAWIPGPTPAQLDTGVEGRIVHSALLGNLDWSTNYEYQVAHVAGGQTIATYGGQFKTRQAPGDSTPFRFTFFGDTADERTPAVTPAIAQLLTQLDPAFNIVGGDVVQNTGQHFEYDRRHDPSQNPVHSDWSRDHLEVNVIGNHEWAANNGKPFEDTYSNPIVNLAGNRPEHNYAWRYGDVLFVTIDSTISSANTGNLNTQLAWAASVLSASDAPWKIFMAHHPLVCDNHQTAPVDAYYFTQVMAMCRAYGVDLVLTGHDHSYQASWPFADSIGTLVTETNSDYVRGAGTTHVIAGLGGGNWQGTPSNAPDDYYLRQAWNKHSADPVDFGMLSIDVTSDRLTVRYHTILGEVRDTFTIGADVDPPDAVLVGDNQPGDADAALHQAAWQNQPQFQVRLTDDSNVAPQAPTLVTLTRDMVPVPIVTQWDATSGLLTVRPPTGVFGPGNYVLHVAGSQDAAGNAQDWTAQITLAPDTIAPTARLALDGSLDDFDFAANRVLVGQSLSQVTIELSDQTPQGGSEVNPGSPSIVVLADGVPLAAHRYSVQVSPEAAVLSFTPALGTRVWEVRVSGLADIHGNTAADMSFRLEVHQGLKVKDVTLREGLQGYSGTLDTYVQGSTPTTAYGNSSIIVVDEYFQGFPIIGLLKFDLSGVPTGALVQSAQLTYVTNSNVQNSHAMLYRSLVAWDESTTWNTWGPHPGVNPGVDYVTTPTAFINGKPGSHTVDVLADVRYWQGAPNRGWTFRALDNLGTTIFSSEHATAANRPSLTLRYAILTQAPAVFDPTLGGGARPLSDTPGQALDDATLAAIASDVAMRQLQATRAWLTDAGELGQPQRRAKAPGWPVEGSG